VDKVPPGALTVDGQKTSLPVNLMLFESGISSKGFYSRPEEMKYPAANGRSIKNFKYRGSA
jgi:hypothetical protein